MLQQEKSQLNITPKKGEEGEKETQTQLQPFMMIISEKIKDYEEKITCIERLFDTL